MTQLEGIRNFAINIRATMLKMRNREKLTETEQESVVQFYLEVIDYAGKASTGEVRVK